MRDFQLHGVKGARPNLAFISIVGPVFFYSPAHREVRDVCSPSRRRGILVPLSRLVPFQAERPAHKLDYSRRYLRLPADALVRRRRGGKKIG